MIWHTPVSYYTGDTARSLMRAQDVAIRYREMAERVAAPYFAGGKLTFDKERASRKKLARSAKAMQEAATLYDKSVVHLQTVIQALSLARVLLQPQEVDVERQEFYEQAMAQTMPDEFSATLRRNPDQPSEQHSFSIEGMETIGYQLHDFMLARTVAYVAREGHAPKALRAELRLVWDDPAPDSELVDREMQPWFAASDDGTTALPLDGKHRLSVFLTERRTKDGNSDS